VAAVPEPLRRRISFFPGDDEGVFCILSGGSFVRSVCLSCAGGFLLFLLFEFDRMVGVTNNPLRLLFLLLLAAVGGGAERGAWTSDGRTVFFPGIVGGAYDGGVKLLFPLVFNGDGGGDDIGSAEDSRWRLCSSWGFFFRVGALFTGGGFCARGFLLLFPFDFGRMEEVTMNPMWLLFPLLLAVVGGETERNV